MLVNRIGGFMAEETGVTVVFTAEEIDLLKKTIASVNIPGQFLDQFYAIKQKLEYPQEASNG